MSCFCVVMNNEAGRKNLRKMPTLQQPNNSRGLYREHTWFKYGGLSMPTITTNNTESTYFGDSALTQPEA